MPTGKLIKFSYVNEHGDFPAMLAHFGLDNSRKGDQLRLLCPFHDDTKPSLNITAPSRKCLDLADMGFGGVSLSRHCRGS